MLKVKNIIVEVRNLAKDRIGQIAIKDIKELEIVINHNNVGTWSLTLSSKHQLVKTLRKKGSGIVVATDSGTLISGNMTSVTYKFTAEDPQGLMTVTGVDDNQYLMDALAYPDPSNTADNQTASKNTRTGSSEKVIKDFVRYNIGPSAISSRKIPSLSIETNLDRGPVITKSARFQTLGLICYEVALVSEIGFKIAQVNDSMVFKVYEPVDRTQDIAWSIENENISDSTFSFNAPVVTHAIVGGKGTGTDRLMKTYTTSAATTAAAQWGRRIETFVDEKTADTTAELNQAGAEAISGGLVVSSSEVTPSDATTSFMTDWNLGDLVSVKVNEDIELTAIIETVGILLNNEGITIKATVNKSNRKDTLNAQVAQTQTTAEGGGGFKRTSVTFTTPSIAPNASWVSSITMQSAFRILKVASNAKCRLRMYSNDTGQATDLGRPLGTRPYDSNGLLLEFAFDNTLLLSGLNPTVDGFTDSGSLIVPVTVENTTLAARTFTITLTYIQTE